MKKNPQILVKQYSKVRQTILKRAEIGSILLSIALFFLFFSIPVFLTAGEQVVKNATPGETDRNINQIIDNNIVADQQRPEDNSFISLFNGKDLTGWCYRSKVSDNIVTEPFEGKTESKDSRYMAKDNMLTINPWDEAKGPHWVNLWNVKVFSGDFILTIEFRASTNADSGIFLRGKQLQCRDYLVAGPYKELKNYKPQDWNKIEVVVKNNIAHCTCNGEILEDALLIPATGSIGLEADRGRMDYRNILIKAL
jgi:hypothetical protein